MTAPELNTLPCGGCGNADPKKRCMGCMHDFGTPDSAWVRGHITAPAKSDANLSQAAVAAALQGAVKPLEWENDQAKGLGDIIYGITIDQERLARGQTLWEAWCGRSHEHEYSGDPIDIGTADTKEGAIALADAAHAKHVAQYLSTPPDAMAALEAVKRQVRLDLMRQVLTAIYEGKVKQGLVDVRYDIARGGTADQCLEEVFTMQLAILAGKTTLLAFGDYLGPDDKQTISKEDMLAEAEKRGRNQALEESAMVADSVASGFDLQSRDPDNLLQEVAAADCACLIATKIRAMKGDE